MPFFGSEPFDSAEASYVRAGANHAGFFRVTVKGHAHKVSFGFQLRRDPNWVGGLKIDVMGWTGPLTEGTAPYTVSADFDGYYLPEIVVAGSKKSEVVKVSEVPFRSEEDFAKHFKAA